jgi:RimJ/RimL family protein N-acetyltransferase
MLLMWANDPAVRRASFSQNPIIPATHRRWFADRLADANTRMWILESKGQPCGVVRVQKEGETAELSYSITAVYRKRKLAVPMLQMALEVIGEQWPGIRLRAYVRPDNTSSIRSLLSAEFQQVESTQKKISLEWQTCEGNS